MKILSILFLALSIWSCSGDNCNPESKSYTFYEGQLHIDTSFFIGYQIVDGDDLIFEYAHKREECEDIADDEVTERILFQIAPDASITEASNSGIISIYVVSSMLPYSYQITTSTVKGTKKSDNRYAIEAQFTYADRSGDLIEIEIDEDFERK